MVMTRIPLQLPEGMHEQVRQVAHEQHCSMADIIRQAVQEYFAERGGRPHPEWVRVQGGWNARIGSVNLQAYLDPETLESAKWSVTVTGKADLLKQAQEEAELCAGRLVDYK